MAPKVIISIGRQRTQEVAVLHFPEEDTLIKVIRSKHETRRSATMRSWYVPASKFKLNDFMKLMKGIAWVDYTGRKTSVVKQAAANPGTKPEFIEDDVFRTMIPLKAKESEEAVSASECDKVRRKVRRRLGEKFGGSSESEEDYIRLTEEIRKKYGRNHCLDAPGTGNYNGRDRTENG